MTRRPTSIEEQRSDLEKTLDDRALHEDFKRLARLSAARPLPTRVDATIALGDHTTEAICLEASNEGLGLLVPPSARPVPGQPLELISLGKPDAPMMRHVDCRVERVSAVEGTDVLFVSATFEPREEREAAPLRLTNALRVRAVIESAAAGGELVTVSSDHGEKSQAFAARVEGAELHLGPPGFRWQQGQVLTVSLRVNDRQLLGHVSVTRVSADELVLPLPSALVEKPLGVNLRACSFCEGATVSFGSPLSGRRRTRSLLELSATGLRFKVDPADVLPAGLRLGEVVLEVGGQLLRGAAVITSLGQLEFTELKADDRQRLLSLLLNHRVAGARCGAAVRFENIWALFQEEGAQWRDHPRPPTEAQRVLGDGAHGLGKTVALVRDGELVAHASGLRIYSRTWLSQHLLVKSGFHRAGALSQQVMSLSFEYGEALPDVDYVRGLWRVSPSGAERIYDTVSARLLKPGLAYRVRFEPMRLRLDRPPTPGPLRVREAGPDDERDFLEFVGQSEDPVKLLSDDLVPGELRLETLSRRYAALGLSRARSLTVVEDEHGAPLGWALVQTMSPGLFWAELYSSFRLFLRAPLGPLADQARRSLAAHAAGLAHRQGRLEAECHASAADVTGLEALGFVRLGAVYEFGAHRGVVREFTHQMSALLARCRRRERGEAKYAEEPA